LLVSKIKDKLNSKPGIVGRISNKINYSKHKHIVTCCIIEKLVGIWLLEIYLGKNMCHDDAYFDELDAMNEDLHKFYSSNPEKFKKLTKFPQNGVQPLDSELFPSRVSLPSNSINIKEDLFCHRYQLAFRMSCIINVRSKHILKLKSSHMSEHEMEKYLSFLYSFAVYMLKKA
jgi:hypothetical protein